MSRHIYYLIVDSPERSNSIGHGLSVLADQFLAQSEGTLSAFVAVIVPHEDGIRMRPTVTLEEVKGG